MKQLLLLLALFLFVQGYSQVDKSVSLLESNTYGYVDGIRLDSIDAAYAVFDVNVGNRVHFNFGQNLTDSKKFLVTDTKGKPLSFPINSAAFLFNFFHYNRWELVSSDGTDAWVLKKQ